MAEPGMDRNAVKAQLTAIRPQMMALFADQRKDIAVCGEKMELTIAGGRRELLHYSSGKATAPVYIDVHGGGFTWGTIADGDHFCRQISQTFGWEAYSVDYPLTPDAEYPAQLNWVYETICYLRDHAAQFHIDPEHIVIGGRSAGANLAAALCLLAKEKGDFQFAVQILDHPWLDLCGLIGWSAEERYLGEGALPQEAMMGLAWGYADLPQMREILCSPLAASEEELAGLPPAVIQTCELDSLRPEGELYARHLKEAGVTVRHHCMEGAAHGFTEGETEIGEQGRQWLIRQLGEICGQK